MKPILVFLFFAAGLMAQYTPPSGGGGGSGTVTSFSAGALSPLFTTSVATSTTTPSLSFSLSSAAQNSVLAGPASGGAGAPSYQTAPTFSAANLTNLPSLPYPGAGITVSTGSAWGTSLTAPTGALVGVGQANTYTAGMKQTFQSSSTTAGEAFGGITADPSALVLGDRWYRSDTYQMSFYNGTNTMRLLGVGATTGNPVNYTLAMPASSAATITFPSATSTLAGLAVANTFTQTANAFFIGNGQNFTFGDIGNGWYFGNDGSGNLYMSEKSGTSSFYLESSQGANILTSIGLSAKFANIGPGALRNSVGRNTYTLLVNNPITTTGITTMVCEDGAGQSTTACIQARDSTGALNASITGAGAYLGTTYTATAAAPTVAASQVGFGGTTAAVANCGAVATACLVINVAGTTRYIPYY